MSQRPYEGWHLVIPDRDRVAQTARELLSLAQSPADVRSQRGGREFLVAPYIADAYNMPTTSATKRPRRRSKEGA